MKPSRFVLCCQISEDEYALYHTVTGKFAVCDSLVASLFPKEVGPSANKQHALGSNPEATPRTTDNSLESNNSLDESTDEFQTNVSSHVDSLPSSILEELHTAGFLVDNQIDEIAEQENRFRNAISNTDQLWLAIAPTYACNCRCAYCYEQDKAAAKSVMSKEVIDALLAFVENRYKAISFNSLFVEWYGGDPQLCLDTVRHISNKLIAFCEEHQLDYDSMMFSNATRIDKDEANLIKDCKVSSMIITIDGPRELHNLRRPAVDCEDAYENILNALKHLQNVGIRTDIMMNTDKVNFAQLDQLQKELAAFNVTPTLTKLNDYSHTFNCAGEGRFYKPHFDLYTHEEFAYTLFEQQNKSGLSKEIIEALLAPYNHFCSGQRHQAYVIDAFGDVYKCDGWMGDKSKAIFNICDQELPNNAYTSCAFNPFEHNDCSTCNLLPLCWGTCSWERECCGYPCHPLTHTAAKYLAQYRSYFPARTKAFEVFN